MKKYFLYSSEQYKTRTNIEKKLGRKYVPGYVFVNGENKPFTEINTKYNSRFKDTQIVYYGEEKDVKFTKPQVINRGR